MSGRSDSPGALPRHREEGRDRPRRDDTRHRDSHRRRSRSREGSGHNKHSDRTRRGRDRSYSNSRSRSRSPSPRRSRSPKRRQRSRSPNRSRSRSPRRRDDSPSSSRHHRRRRRSRSRSASRSRSPSDRGESSRGHRRRKDKHRRSSGSRERRERKRAKKEKKKNKGAVTGQWGQYGIINESDMYNKEEEFRAWLLEEKMVNRETLSKDQERKHFAQFVEDFNTATLPHEKYYNMAKYDARMNMVRNGELLVQDTSYDPNADLAAHTSSHKRAVVEHDSYLNKDQLLALRKVQNERIEAGKMKAMGLEVRNSMGVRMDGNEYEPGRR